MNMALRLVSAVVAIPLLSACGGADRLDAESLETVELLVENDPEMPTALWVSWSTDLPGDSWVEYSVEGEDTQTTAVSSQTADHRLQLLGLPPETTVAIRAYTRVGDLEYQRDAVAWTGSVPEDLPRFRLDALQDSAEDGARFTLIPVNGRAGSWLEIVDRQGRPVWYYDNPNDTNLADAELDLELGEVVVLEQDWRNGESALLRFALDAPEQITSTPAPFAHHALAVLPDGAVAYMAEDVGTWSFEGGAPEEVVGEAIWELSADGQTRKIFSTWDWADPQEYEFWDGIYEDAVDWTHGNAVCYRAETDSLLISLRNPAVLLEVDRQTGAVLAEYGGEGDDWGFSEGSEPFFFQHDARWTPGGNLLMMSTSMRDDGQMSQKSIAIEYALDHATHQLTEVWRYGDDEGLHAQSHGGATRLPNGNTLVNWGEPTGVVREVTQTGTIVWQVQPEAVEGDSVFVFAALPFNGFYDPAGE